MLMNNSLLFHTEKNVSMISVCLRKGAIFHLNPILSQSLDTCQVVLLASVKENPAG